MLRVHGDGDSGVMLLRAPEFYHYHDTLSKYTSQQSIENIKMLWHEQKGKTARVSQFVDGRNCFDL
jgi:hypothetical protein